MKPENRAIDRLRKKLDAIKSVNIFLDKNNNQYSSGQLDLNVEAYRFIGFIEAKYRANKTEAGSRMSPIPIVKQCSELQLKRLRRHALNRIPCGIFCGFDGPNRQNRTYTLFHPIADHASASIIWPTEVKIVDLDALVRQLIEWTKTYEIHYQPEMGKTN